MKIKLFANKQQGAATLVTVVVLLISITLVSFITAKTVLVETQITADNYRTSQASAAASAAMDQAIAYFYDGGLDHNTDSVVDFTSGAPAALTLSAGSQTTTAQFFFNNTPGNRCDCTGGGCMAVTNMSRALVTATGWSDDGSAKRTVSQCVTTFDLLDADGPQQAFVGRSSLGAFGNAKIINRYNNSTIWVGGSFDTPDAAFGTYLRPSGTETADYTTQQLDSSCAASPCNDVNNPGPNDQMVSNRNAGAGVDIVSNDPTLNGKTADEFFDMFFSQTKTEIRTAADSADQLFASGTNLDGKAGLIWVDGDATLSNGTVIGSPTKPAIVIIDGDATLHNTTIYGVVYVTGEFDFRGNPVVKGSMVGESTAPSTGAGTPTIVYKPWTNNGNSPPFITGTGAIVSGSWQDW